jgi:hypothetical protein
MLVMAPAVGARVDSGAATHRNTTHFRPRTPTPEMSGDGTGGSRAAKRRARHRGQAQPSVGGSAIRGSTAVAAALAPPTLVLDPGALCEPVAPALREWTVPLPSREDALSDGFQTALAQARLIQGHKYRYGATLLAGDDCIPLRTGSNKKVFHRSNIHAEVSALKGCVVPQGKDMLIVRLAPAPPPTEAAVAAAAGGLYRNEKLLNARPCAACELKMMSRGLRRCFFTLPGGAMGVIDLQLPATRPPRMEAADTGDASNAAGTSGGGSDGGSDGGEGAQRGGSRLNGGSAARHRETGGGGRSAAYGAGEGGILQGDGALYLGGLQAQRDKPTRSAARDSPPSGASTGRAGQGQGDAAPWRCVNKFEFDAPLICGGDGVAGRGGEYFPGVKGDGSCVRQKKRRKVGGGASGGGAQSDLAAEGRER